MDQELAFAKTLEEIRTLAKKQNHVLSKEQVEEAFESIDIRGEALTPVYEYLKTKKIGIGKPVDAEETMDQEDLDFLSVYKEEIRQLTEYTQGEKDAFCISAMAGEKEAKHAIIKMMLPDVLDIAELYTGQGVCLEDLIGEGNVALSTGVEMLGCLEKPDEVEGMLGKMIMDAMEDLIHEDEEETKIDKKIVERVNEIAKDAKELAESLQRKVTVEELMQETKHTEKEIRDAIRISGQKIEYFEEQS